MRKATLKDTKLITTILTDSFKTNKSIINVTRKGRNQLKRINLLMKFFFLNAYHNGDVFLSDDEKACIMLLTNEKKRKSLFVKLQFILWNINLFFNVLGVKNVRNVLQREKAINQNHPKEPFLHLYYVGVLSKYQGNGIGTKLISETINYYEEYKIVYLETSNERNIPLYEKLGFEVVNVHSELEITLYIMKKKL
ncbi:GNAT family N-acetyltransferase [Tenacibaculum caenipelagi]|uniref:Acetyltransferase (GNAT) family protein n=1 Tax=Tenacibaculum caenipelagi TaxID=1325435 RepID=A0A4V3D2T1_9FLAO|nr:GNAT family N-acetyltransferase [Tenacibaculum caenipelagi]TDQ22785.1 acetyltransferase (GNAT) family protein [Tenacibaculum caenipelagi]